MIYIASPFYEDTDWFSHHGVKGQKWGIRRFQNKDGSLTDEGKKRIRSSNKKQRKDESDPKNPYLTNKSVYEMSEQELLSDIRRLGLEKQYRSLMRELYPTKSQKTSKNIEKGFKFAGDILSTGLRNVGTSSVSNIAGHNLNELGKALGLKYEIYTKQKKGK